MTAGEGTRPDETLGLDESIEAGAVVLAIVKCSGPDLWERLNERERAVVMKAVRGQAREVIRQAAPVIAAAVRSATLDETVSAIEAKMPEPHAYDMHVWTERGALRRAVAAVRSLRSGADHG